MRTLVDIPDKKIAALARRCSIEGVSRAELIRRAIDHYLTAETESDPNAFGLWKKHSSQKNGLDYQEELRGEW